MQSKRFQPMQQFEPKSTQFVNPKVRYSKVAVKSQIKLLWTKRAVVVKLSGGEVARIQKEVVDWRRVGDEKRENRNVGLRFGPI